MPQDRALAIVPLNVKRAFQATLFDTAIAPEAPASPPADVPDTVFVTGSVWSG